MVLRVHAAASLVNLRGQIKLHVPVVTCLEVILDKQRRIGTKSELNSTTQWCSFGKCHQVSQGKRGCDWLVHRQGDPLLGLLCLSWFQHHIPSTHIALHT